MRKNTPHPGANALALTCVFVDFFRRLACALCTPGNGLQSLAAAGASSSFFATPEYKLCACGHDGRNTHNVIFRAALLTRQIAKTGKECPQQARTARVIGKSYSPDFCERLKRLADNSNKKQVS